MATTDTPDETPATVVTALPDPPKPDKTRWSGNIPTGLAEWLSTTADQRMCSEALLVAKGLELLQGHLPPLP